MSVSSSQELIERLRTIVGRRRVLTRPSRMSRFATGYRTGEGHPVAVAQPGSLVELWRVFKACVEADHIVIAQAANTGLTGGSTPQGDYDRPVVVINTLRIKGILPIGGGEQVICLAGATLDELERELAPYGREPHSVIGSSCLGASVVGGVCNNSGGALVQRGPAYTEYALFAQVDEQGQVHLRNHLGVRLGEEPEDVLRALEDRRFADPDIVFDDRAGSAAGDYAQVVRAIDEPTPARFNADPKRLFEASGSAGKVLVFAVRLDTFARPRRSAVFYVGTNDTTQLTELRRHILAGGGPLPIMGEYIHRDAFDLAASHGKDTVLAIRWLGTARLPKLFQTKEAIDRLAEATRILPKRLSDRLLQAASRLFPQHLPPRIRAFRDLYEHHLILKVADEAVDGTRELLRETFPNASGDVFECDANEAEAAMLHRFAVAGAAVRYRSVHPELIEDIVAIDVALRRDDREWFERLPAEIEAQLLGKLYYGHFFCHVFHQDYLVRKGVDAAALEHSILALMDARGAEYPPEHNVGHLYAAKPALAEHYRRLDPSNRLNPGLGGTSRCLHHAAPSGAG